MLYKLADSSTTQPRPSDLTYVESGNSPLMPSKMHDDQASLGAGTVPNGRRVTHAEDEHARIAGLPKAELGPPAQR